MIAEIARIVEHACTQESNIFGYGIWTHHITLVVRHSRDLCTLFNADPEIVELAALLHDYASIRDETLYEDHHVHGPLEAEKLLSKYDYPPEKIEAVKECIASHRGSVSGEPMTPEAACLANADALAHIEQVSSLLHLVFVRRGMGIDEGTAWVRAKLKRSWAKLNPQVQAQARERFEGALMTLGRPDDSSRE